MNSKTCPHCKPVQPDDHAAGTCSFCGETLSTNQIKPTPGLAPVKIRWLWFWLALLGPPVLTMLTAMFMHEFTSGSASNEGVSPVVALIAAATGGIACGIIMGLKMGKDIPARVGIAIATAIPMSLLCLFLCFLGCNLGGYQFTIR
jgi:hypothetical protein